jgi:hypothetical protein
MDVWETAFKGMYKAVSILAGVAASKAAGTPGLFSLIIGSASIEAVPAAAGSMMAGAIPGLAMGFHSPHALVLFNALRASKKYSDKREQLRGIQDSMDKFIMVINESISASSPLPSTLPETGADVFFDKKRYAEYLKLVDAATKTTRAFVDNLDLILNDIERCVEEWNNFLKDLRKFMKADKPRNVFEALEHYSLHNERDWAWYKDETGFSTSCNKLVGHRNEWSKLIDYGRRLSLPVLNFDTD